MKYILILLLLFITINAGAQTNLKGEIKDYNNEAAYGATVTVSSLPDSQQVATTTANSQGRFEFSNLRSNSYFIKISYQGMKPYQSPTIALKTNTVTLPVIFLQPVKAKELNEVVVKSSKPMIVQEADRTIINVEAMGSAATLSANEVLERTPGVTVDQNGSIQLNGRTGVMVLIDGRSTYMSGNDLMIYLKSLPAQMLDKLELMTEPPAKYDAGGSSVINIVLKKNRLYGLTGNVGSTQSMGYTWRSYNNLNLNYRQGKLNFFSGIGISRDANRTVTLSTRTITEGANSQQYKSENTSLNKNLNGNIRLGFDYDATKKTVIGGQFFLQKSNREDEAVFNNIVNTQNQYGNNDGEFDWSSMSASFNFIHKPGKQGSEWSGDISYQEFANNGARNFTSTNYTDTQVFNNTFYTPANILTVKTDYKTSISKKTTLEMGLKIGLVKNNNQADVAVKDGADFVADPSQSNHFVYDENINAAYLSMKHNFNSRTSMQMGLRAEDTNIEGNLAPNLAVPGEKFSQKYTDLFPTFFLMRQLDSLGKHSLSFSYGRRLNRPNYQMFNPFLNYIDDYSYSSGNPAFRPFYLHNLQLRYQNNKGLNVGVAVDFADGIGGHLNNREGDKFVRRPYNLGKGYRIGLIVNYNKRLNKYWNMNIGAQAFRFDVKGTINGDYAITKYFSYRINFNQQFNFGKGWSAELFSNVGGKEQLFTMDVKGYAYVYAGIGKKILKDKGNIRLLVDDPAWTNYRPETMSNYQNTSQYRKSRNDTRRIGFSLSYRFGNEKYNRKRQTEDAAEEERRRVN